jgi:hypothetical protein
MDKIHDFLIEAGWLWAATAAVVAVASCVHYFMASGERRALTRRIDHQRTKQQPEDFESSITGGA